MNLIGQMSASEQKDVVRCELIDNIFQAMGLINGEWVHKDVIEKSYPYILENRELIEKSLPCKTVKPTKNSNMWEMLGKSEGEKSIRSLLAFARRLARYRHFAIVWKRKTIRINKSKTKEEAYYKLLRN
jgi:hypothetical protein